MDDVQVDDDGRTIDLGSASVDELKQAWRYHCDRGDRLRFWAAERPLDDPERGAALEREQEHRRVAVRVSEVIQARGESL